MGLTLRKRGEGGGGCTETGRGSGREPQDHGKKPCRRFKTPVDIVPPSPETPEYGAVQL